MRKLAAEARQAARRPGRAQHLGRVNDRAIRAGADGIGEAAGTMSRRHRSCRPTVRIIYEAARICRAGLVQCRCLQSRDVGPLVSRLGVVKTRYLCCEGNRKHDPGR
jgi:hypothetical protein